MGFQIRNYHSASSCRSRGLWVPKGDTITEMWLYMHTVFITWDPVKFNTDSHAHGRFSICATQRKGGWDRHIFSSSNRFWKYECELKLLFLRNNHSS